MEHIIIEAIMNHGNNSTLTQEQHQFRSDYHHETQFINTMEDLRRIVGYSFQVNSLVPDFSSVKQGGPLMILGWVGLVW